MSKKVRTLGIKAAQGRVIAHVPLPEASVLGLAQLFPDPEPGAPAINVALLRDHLLREGRVELKAAMEIVKQATEYLDGEPNLVELNAPVTIFGDIHGQYHDLVASLKKLDEPKDNDPWLFLGDYVDRGMFSVEVILFLFALKIQYPRAVYLLRGNHECRHLGNHYSFKKECLAKYKSQELYDLIMFAFDRLPLAALIDAGNMHRFLALHGGISPDLFTLDDLNEMDRKMEPPHKGLMCDILWSDPLEDDTGNGLDDETMQEWYAVDFEPNPNRGCGYVFGYKATIDFLERNMLTSIIRTGRRFPLLITIFSAPNYCGYYENQGAHLRLLPAKRCYGDATPREEKEEDPEAPVDDERDREEAAKIQTPKDGPVDTPTQDYPENESDQELEEKLGKPSTPEEAALEGEIVDLDHDNTFQKHKKEEEKRDKERAAERAATPRRLDLNDALGGSEQEDVIEMSKEEKSPEADDEEDDEEEGDVKVRDRDPSPYRTSLARHKEKMKRALDSITRLESEKKLKIPSLTISGDLIKDEVDDELPAVEEEEPQAPAESIEDVAVEQPNPDFFPRILYMQYDWVPAPFVLPSFENAIQYSIPYVIDRLTQVMSTLLNLDVEEKGDEHFYAEVERRIRAPRVNQISELLSPRSSPASPEGYRPLTSRRHIQPGSVKKFITAIEGGKGKPGSSNSLKQRRKSITALDGTFKRRVKTYMAAADRNFERIKQEDRQNEMMPPEEDENKEESKA